MGKGVFVCHIGGQKCPKSAKSPGYRKLPPLRKINFVFYLDIIYKYMLVPLNLEYLRLVTFIVMIAATVQLIEMVIERFSEKLYNALGIFLPLITVNCAILGVSLFMLNKPYSLIETAAFGAGGGFGWFIAISIIGSIREKIDESKLPRGLAGPGITLIIIGIIALAFIGFSGMIKI